jgi:hypothetical protein
MEATTAERVPQHMQALALANRIRLSRAAMKRRVYAGELKASALLRDTPWEVLSMTIGELLRSQRRWGRTRARRLLTQHAINENREIGRLTIRQLEVLAQACDEARRRSVCQ